MQEMFLEHAKNTLFGYCRARCGGDAKVRRAVEVAERSHGGQTRDGGEDYIIHPLRVATHYLVFADAPTEEEVVAAVLHDVLEDDPAMTHAALAREFGATVADAVLVLSRKTPDWKLSAEDYRLALLKAPRFAQVIKLCDRFDNILSLSTCPDAAKVGRYLDQTEYYYGDLGRAAHGQLLQVILAEIERIRERCGEPG